MRLTATTAITIAALAGTAAAQNYELVWSDEFDGSSLNTDSWEIQLGTGTAYGLPAGWGNEELQYYTNFGSNLDVSNGTLKIVARNESFGGRNYTSGRIRTRGNHDFQYGRFEGRIKMPSTQGVWPAFWMLPSDTPYGTWAASGEIDIVESVNIADRIYGTIHHGNPWPGNQSRGANVADGTDFSQDFHVYAVEWEPNALRWYLDGELYFELDETDWFSSNAPGDPNAPFDVPFHLLLNVAVGGQFPGDPNGGSTFPQTMEVDYVRVYQQAQSPFGAGPVAIPGRLEAEDFDQGFNGQSYNDFDSGNNGGAYRDTDVDIQVCNEGGFNIGWMRVNEWLEFTVDVQTAGTYDLEARVASLSTGGQFRIEQDGVDLTGTIQAPATGGWQNWTTVTSEIELDAGEQVIRFANTGTDGQGFNLNHFTFTLQSTQCSPADLNGDGSLDFADVSAFLAAFAGGDLAVDFDDSGTLDFGDVSGFLAAFGAGCP